MLGFLKAFPLAPAISAPNGKEAEFRAAPLLRIDLVWNDPKNTAYDISGRQGVDRPLFFYKFYEVFANQADLEAHSAKPVFRRVKMEITAAPMK
jgi:quinol monooxygenase YgiN